MAFAIYHGCHKGSQLRLVALDPMFVDVVVVSGKSGGEDLHLFLPPPAPHFLHSVEGSPGLGAFQPRGFPVDPPYLSVDEVEGVLIL